MKNEVWMVTGASSGIGLELIKYLLRKGRCVAATTRNKESLIKNIGIAESKNLISLEVDLSLEESVRDGVLEVIKYYENIDVLVNNAGYEQIGYVEELSIEEFKHNLEINLFAPIRLIKNILPYMRKRNSGYIMNITSISGNCYSWPGSCSYNISKVGLDSLSKTLYSELNSFGIFSTSVILGQFNTNFFEHQKLPARTNPIYDLYRKEKIPKNEKEKHCQRGDVKKLVEVLFEMSELDVPPANIYAGEDAYTLAFNKAISILKNLERWEALSRHLDI